jgi:hypothetical protein
VILPAMLLGRWSIDPVKERPQGICVAKGENFLKLPFGELALQVDSRAICGKICPNRLL